ncbi:MAG: FMN-binding protein [Candidatus Saccharimonadales bacterium]
MKIMKYLSRIILSLFVIGLVVGYSFYQRITAGQSSNQNMMAASVSMLKPPKMYQDGSYTGPVTNAFYGNVQVKITVKNHYIAKVVFLKQPHSSSYCKMVNAKAVPALTKEALHTQTSKVHVIAGATQTSGAFVKSIAAALAKA